MNRPLALALALTFTALTTSCQTGSGAATDCLEGTLDVRGPDPGSELRLLSDDDELLIRGDLEARLRGLSGLGVSACGLRRGGAFEPSSFRLLDVQGYPARLGVLVREDGAWLLRDDAGSIPLAGVSPALARHLGSEVWVAGGLNDGAMAVVAYGLVR